MSVLPPIARGTSVTMSRDDYERARNRLAELERENTRLRAEVESLRAQLAHPDQVLAEGVRAVLSAGALVKERDRYLATDHGKGLVPDARPTVGIELREKWRRDLPGAVWKLLDAIINSYPGGITKYDLAAATGYRADTGHFGNLLSRLTGGGLVTKDGDRYHAMEEFFVA